MTSTELLAKIRAYLKEPTEAYFTTAELTIWINDASFEATKDINYPWKKQTITTAVGTVGYNLASDYIKVQPLFIVTYDSKKVDKRSVSYLESKYPNYLSASNGTPSIYYHELPGVISLYVPPDAEASLIVPYVYKETLLPATSLTGTLTFTNGSTSVTASGGAFINELRAEDWIQLDADAVISQVASITSDDALTLEENYTGTGGAGAGSRGQNTNLVATNYPNLIIYRVMIDCEIKRTEKGKRGTQTKLWADLYNAEVFKTRGILAEFVRGLGETTIGPDNRSK